MQSLNHRLNIFGQANVPVGIGSPLQVFFNAGHIVGVVSCPTASLPLVKQAQANAIKGIESTSLGPPLRGGEKHEIGSN